MNKHFCPRCGTEYTPGAKFCPKCGYRLTKNTADAAEKPNAQQNEKVTDRTKKPVKSSDDKGKAAAQPVEKDSAKVTDKTEKSVKTTDKKKPAEALDKKKAATTSQQAAVVSKKRTNPLKGHRWFWYLGLILAIVIIVFAIYNIYQTNQNYTDLLRQRSGGDLYTGDMFGGDISEDLADFAGLGFAILAIGLVSLVALFLPKHWLRRKKLLVQGGVLVVIFLAGLVNLNVNHHYTMTSTGLGENYTKNYLSGHIYRYNYLANQKNDDDNWDQFGHGPAVANYTHVFLKFNSDGTLGVNVNPYWVDDDETSYQNSQIDDYRTTGTWSVSEDGQVNIEWDPTDTGAYKYETVRVKRKHHKHHHKYKYVRRLVAQYVDAAGDPDTSLPHTFPGDAINGKVKFGDDSFKVNGVTLYKLNSDGEAINEQ